jgi:hypothetical protein
MTAKQDGIIVPLNRKATTEAQGEMADDSQMVLPPGGGGGGAAGSGVAVRYVVLHHTGVVPEHFDVMIQLPGAAKLMTWRILAPPETWGREMPAAERLADHRLAYMTYEGEISGGRGTVTRVAEGEAEYFASATRAFRLRLYGDITCEIQMPITGLRD